MRSVVSFVLIATMTALAVPVLGQDSDCSAHPVLNMDFQIQELSFYTPWIAGMSPSFLGDWLLLEGRIDSPRNLQDFLLETTIQYLAGAPLLNFSVLFRRQDSGEGYGLVLVHELGRPYFSLKEGTSPFETTTVSAQLYYYSGDQGESLLLGTSDALDYDLGLPHTLSIVAKGSQFKAYVDGVLAVAVEDDTCSDSGALMLYAITNHLRSWDFGSIPVLYAMDSLSIWDLACIPR